MPASASVDNVHQSDQNAGRNRFLCCVAGFFLAAWALFELERNDNRLPFFIPRQDDQEHTYWRSAGDTASLLVVSVVFLVLPYVLFKTFMDYVDPEHHSPMGAADANAIATDVEDFIEFS